MRILQWRKGHCPCSLYHCTMPVLDYIWVIEALHHMVQRIISGTPLDLVLQFWRQVYSLRTVPSLTNFWHICGLSLTHPSYNIGANQSGQYRREPIRLDTLFSDELLAYVIRKSIAGASHSMSRYDTVSMPTRGLRSLCSSMNHSHLWYDILPLMVSWTLGAYYEDSLHFSFWLAFSISEMTYHLWYNCLGLFAHYWLLLLWLA